MCGCMKATNSAWLLRRCFVLASTCSEGATEDYTNDSLDPQYHRALPRHGDCRSCLPAPLDQRLFDSDEDLESTDSEGPKS